MAERRLPQNQEQQKGNRGEQEVRAQPVSSQRRRKETEDEADQGHEEGHDRPDMHEFVLEMMARKQLPEPAFQSVYGPGRRTRRPGGGSGACPGRTRLVSLRLAAETAEAGVGLDRLAAFPAEH